MNGSSITMKNWYQDKLRLPRLYNLLSKNHKKANKIELMNFGVIVPKRFQAMKCWWIVITHSQKVANIWLRLTYETHPQASSLTLSTHLFSAAFRYKKQRFMVYLQCNMDTCKTNKAMRALCLDFLKSMSKRVQECQKSTMPSWEWVRLVKRQYSLQSRIHKSSNWKPSNTFGNCIIPQKHVSAHHRRPLSTISPCHCFIKQCPLLLHKPG